MNELLAVVIAAAAYFLLKRAERHGYDQGYDDGINDRRPKHRTPIGYHQNDKTPQQ